jgi:proteasome accessory factor B
MPSHDKLVRWIDLITALLRRRYPASFEELAREVPDYSYEGEPSESLKRKFERDKDELRDAGVAIETVPDADGEPSRYALSAKAFYLPFLVIVGADAPAGARAEGYRALATLALLPEEAAMMRRAAERVALLDAPTLADDANHALRKLRYDLPGELPAPPESAPARDGAAFRALVDASERAKRVTFSYHSMGRSERSERTVEPYGLVYLTGHWYLVAHDPAVGEIRHYRTSRMHDVQVNGKQPATPDFTVPSTFDLKAHARSRQAWELGTGELEAIDVQFRGRGGDVTSALRLGEPVAHDGAESRLRFQVRRRDTFLRWVLAFAGDAEPVAPPDVVDEWRTLVRETLAVHRRAADASTAEVA